MAQGVSLEGLLLNGDMGGNDNIDGAMQPTTASSCHSHSMQRKSRSPLRARASLQQHNTNFHDHDDENPTKVGTSMKVTDFISQKSRRASPDYVMLDKKKNQVEDGHPRGCSEDMPTTPRCPQSHTNTSTFLATKPTKNGGTPNKPRPCVDDWERVVQDGKDSKDGTHLIRLLADFIEDFQFGNSNHRKGEYASWVHDSKSLSVENRHSHQLAGQLRKLADVFEKENNCLSLKERRVK